MKVIILEDRPWVMCEALDKLKSMGVEDIQIIYYHSPYTNNPEKYAEFKDKCFGMGVAIKETEENVELKKVLDEDYADQDTIFFFDFELNDGAVYFDQRVNVAYAKQKQAVGDNRIWFYTTAGAYIVDQINKRFEGHNIPVLEFATQENKLVLDYNFIQREIVH